MKASGTVVVQALVYGIALPLFCCTVGRAQETATLADPITATSASPSADASSVTLADAPRVTRTGGPGVVSAEASTVTLVEAPGIARAEPSADSSPQASQPAATGPVDETSDSKWHIYGVGYLWLPGVNGSIGVFGYSAGIHVSVWDLLSKFRFGLMGAAVPSYNRWSVPTDFIWLRIKDDKTISFAPNYSIQAKATASIFTPKVNYLLVNSPRVKVFATGGLRYWYLGNTLSLNPSPLGHSLHDSVSFVDGVGGARFVAPLSPKISIEILGDAGAGGSNLDYQVAGAAAYRTSEKLSLLLGWRYMTLHYQQGPKPFVFDCSITGVVIGAKYRFK